LTSLHHSTNLVTAPMFIPKTKTKTKTKTKPKTKPHRPTQNSRSSRGPLEWSTTA
jgi:hypothetical protein